VVRDVALQPGASVFKLSVAVPRHDHPSTPPLDRFSIACGIFYTRASLDDLSYLAMQHEDRALVLPAFYGATRLVLGECRLGVLQ